LEIRTLGRQLMVEYHGCAPDLLNDVEHVKRSMVEAAKATGATIVGDLFHHFSPHGVSGVVVIAESHLAIHTWPEYGYAAVDLFTCGSEIDPYRGFALLKVALGAEKSEVEEFTRGRFDSDVPLHHKPMVAAG
jgi:S-adenosylmethionine decarboxylase proenzyme